MGPHYCYGGLYKSCIVMLVVVPFFAIIIVELLTYRLLRSVRYTRTCNVSHFTSIIPNNYIWFVTNEEKLWEWQVKSLCIQTCNQSHSQTLEWVWEWEFLWPTSLPPVDQVAYTQRTSSGHFSHQLSVGKLKVAMLDLKDTFVWPSSLRTG